MKERGKYRGWPANLPELFHRRAPRSTCLSVVGGSAYGTIAEPFNDSMGCGGVMQVVPTGLYFDRERQPVEGIDRIGEAAAALTHGHTLGYIPTAALAAQVMLAEPEAAGTFAARSVRAVGAEKRHITAAEAEQIRGGGVIIRTSAKEVLLSKKA